MERQRPDTTGNDIQLYIRSIYSLLRSSADVRVRSLEEAHLYSDSSLHLGARSPEPDLGAFGYAAARLPPSMPEVARVVLGQSRELFASHGLDVSGWRRVRSRGRRRPMLQGQEGTLAMFIASESDIDDVVPILTAYQLEWNKMHLMLEGRTVDVGSDETLAGLLDLEPDAIGHLRRGLGDGFEPLFQAIATRRCDLRLNLLAGSFSQYQRAAQRWWSGIEPLYAPEASRARPVYFVSSNTHAFPNLVGGYALAHADQLVEVARRDDPDSVWADLERALDQQSPDLPNLLQFCMRHYLSVHPERAAEVAAWDRSSGIHTVEDPGQVEVSAQVVELSQIRPERLDPRVRVDGVDQLAGSNAVIVNIDYPLGMAAYHLLSRLGQGVGDIRGVYIMGKAATLNGRVGDVMISKAVQDEHSLNAYLLRNAFTADDISHWLNFGSVLDNQKALTVRSAFLQNRNYMSVFYREGYTVLEMEAGPYLSAIYELGDPRRHPRDEIVNISERAGCEVGILHYASDTPYSRRQELLSKSLGYFGTDSTYACAVAITRRIFEQEIRRLKG